MLVARGHDTSGAEEALLLQSMAEVKDFAGANLPIADMPRVRVLEALSESIGKTSGSNLYPNPNPNQARPLALTCTLTLTLTRRDLWL